MEQQMLVAVEADSAQAERCVQACERCHRACLRAAVDCCLDQRGGRAEPTHFRAMLACAALCHTTADAVLTGYALYEEVCTVCARVCIDCAESCERIGDLAECAEACRRCAESCTLLAGGAPAARASEIER